MTVEKRKAENAALRRRLEEAEETIRAIRSGAVDAFVVEESAGPRVYTLEGADRPYRLLVEQMQQGAAMLQADGTIVYCNRRLADLLGMPHEKLTGAALHDFIASDDRPIYDNLLWQGQNRSGRGEARLRRADGRLVPAYVTCNVLPKDCGAAIGVLITDLTMQRHHEQLTVAHNALRESEEAVRRHTAQFETLLNEVPLGVYLVDADFRIRHVNPSTFQVFGDIPDLIGRDFDEVIHILWPKAFADEVVQRFRHTLETGEPYTCPELIEERLDRGATEYYAWQINRIPLPEGGYGVVCYFREISAQVQARAAIAESEQRLRFVMESAPQKIFTAKPSGDVDYFNPIWTEFTGLSFEEIRDWGWTQFIHPDDVAENVRVWQQSIDTGEPFHFEHRFRRADGEYCWHISRAVALKDAVGKTLMWVGASTDVQDLKQADEATRHRSEQVRRLAEVATRLNSLHDVQSIMGIVNETARSLIGAHQSVSSMTVNEDWRQSLVVVSFSDKYARWRGYDEKPDGSGIYTLVCRTNKPMRLTQAELEAHPAYKRFGKHAPNHPPLRGWLAVPFTGQRHGNVGLIQLSDKYEGEFTEDDEAVLVQLAQMASVAIDNSRLVEDLRDADRRKNEFLAMLAHELRNPLAPIRNALEILRLTGGSGEAVQSASAMMERQVGQMVRLVDDLLDVSRISRGKIELRKGRVELASAVNHAVEAIRPQCQSMNHELTVTLPPQPIYLNGDPTRLAQVIGNLLNNGCKFAERGGRIWLTVEQEGEQAVIRIRDTGIGIAADQLARIFDLFTQVDTSLERTQTGLGIGLTLVKELVRMHGGRVEAHSAGLGQGSEFVVRLPILVETPKPSPEPTVSEPTPTTARRILVVDDNRDSAESLAMLLELTGNKTHTVYDGLAAVESAATFKPDAVLLDIGLPKMNGYEAARKIRQQPWGKKMVLVALTGWGQDEDRQKSREAGFDGHLVKPVDYAALTKLLAELSAG